METICRIHKFIQYFLIYIAIAIIAASILAPVFFGIDKLPKLGIPIFVFMTVIIFVEFILRKTIYVKPNLFLVSDESRKINLPHQCYVLDTFEYDGDKDCFLVQIYPPIMLQESGGENIELERVVIVNRQDKFRMSNIKKWYVFKRWPIQISVMRLIEKIDLNRHKILESDLQFVWEAKAYRSMKSASRTRKIKGVRYCF